MNNKKICIFASSSNSIDEIYTKEAEKTAELLAKKGYNLIFGGGSIGLMGVSATVFKKYNREVISVIPKALNLEDVVFKKSDKIIETDTLNQRKAIMEELADAFVVLPGGFGTVEELMEVITLKQLRYHTKPIAILNTKKFYNNLLKQLETIYKKNFTHKIYKKIYFVAQKPDEIIDYLDNYKPETFNKIFI